MRPVEEILLELVALDIKVWHQDGKLKINAPEGAISPSMRTELTGRKEELLAFLMKNSGTSGNRSIPPFDRSLPVPLTHGQERIWSLSRLDPGSGRYHVPLVFELSGNLDITALELALHELADRHEILRTAFPGETVETARQEISAVSKRKIPVVDISKDLRRFPEQQAKAEIERLLNDEARQPFDIIHGPLWRTTLFRTGRKRHFLSFTMHHLIFDGVSQAIFLKELGLCYEAHLKTRPHGLPPLTLQFADFAGWQRAPSQELSLQAQVDYWSSRLAGDIPALKLPNDLSQGSAPSKSGSAPFSLEPDLSQALLELSRHEKSSPYVVLLSAFLAALYSFTEQEDMILCSPAASREHADVESLLGYFNSLVIIRANLNRPLSFRSLISQVRRSVLDACDHQRVPLQKISQFPNLIRTPLTRAMFSFQDKNARNLDLPGLRTSQTGIRKDSPDFEVALYTFLEDGIFSGTLDFHAGLFSEKAITAMVKRFHEVLSAITKDPGITLETFTGSDRVAEIRRRLLDHPQIDDAFLLPRPASGGLVAYLVLNEDDAPSLETIRDYTISVLPAWTVPEAYIPVDKFPRLPDGSVDPNALPSVEARGSCHEALVAPRTDLEKQLAEVWKKALWLDHDISVTSNFRDLGGHSLLSVQLVLEVEKRLGKRLPDSVAGRLDTIESMAKAIEAGNNGSSSPEESRPVGMSELPDEIYRGLLSYTSSWKGVRNSAGSVIVGLNVEGEKSALFWCLQRDYELSQLARYLGPSQPVYGMRSGNRVMVKSQTNLRMLANHYTREIMEIQPEGPYLIGGNCQAAAIAFEIAKQLKGLGHEIRLLILQEKFVPDDFRGPVALIFGDNSDRNPHRSFHRPGLGWRKYYPGPLHETIVPGSHGRFFEEPNIQILTKTIESRLAEARMKDFSAWEPVEEVTSRQRLPEAAYRAGIQGPGELRERPGEGMVLELVITNLSGVTWQAASASGIRIANHWLSGKGKVVQFLDGASDLPVALAPGESAKVELRVTVPAKVDSYELEIDLVDEGVSWFKDKGSQTLKIPVRASSKRLSLFSFLRKTALREGDSVE
jgi:acyl carrier protein